MDKYNTDNGMDGRAVTELFDVVGCTGYYGALRSTSRYPSTIIRTTATTLTITTTAAHVWNVGDEVIFIGLTVPGDATADFGGLNEEYHIVATVPDTTSFTIEVADTTAYLGTYPGGIGVVDDASLFRKIQTSKDRWNAGLEPKEYSYVQRRSPV
ncbi:unnamed protein product [marine sediment metagenome]|uniref:Uncharacterized protein n=1 Tax=marine sediment metagenome TaxID=412755 RepID=X1L9S6_9ZZZZ